IRLANATEFGLQASVFTQDRARGERIAAQLECGGVCINDFGMCYLNQDLPFGGVKQSGYGRMNGRDGLRAYTNAKAVLTDRFGFSVLPKLYPVGPDDYAKARESIRLLFSFGVGALQPGWPGAAHFAGEVLGVLRRYDFMYYFFHRLMHVRGLMRYCHAVHHRVRSPIANESIFLSPLETLGGLGLLMLAVIVLG